MNIDDTTAKVGIIGSFFNCKKKIENILKMVKYSNLYKLQIGENPFYVKCNGCQISTDLSYILNSSNKDFDNELNDTIMDEDSFYSNYEISDVFVKPEVKIVNDSLNADIYIGNLNGRNIYTNKPLKQILENNIENNNIEFLENFKIEDKIIKKIMDK